MTPVKILLIGRTATGKTSLANQLNKVKNLSTVISYSTRKVANPDEDNHIYVDETEAEFLRDQAVAMTNISGFTYFTTKSEFEAKDVFVVDPDGAVALIKDYPDTLFMIANIRDDEDTRQQILATMTDEFSNLAAIQARDAMEAKIFEAFEAVVDGTSTADNPYHDLINQPNLIHMDIYSRSFNQVEHLSQMGSYMAGFTAEIVESIYGTYNFIQNLITILNNTEHDPELTLQDVLTSMHSDDNHVFVDLINTYLTTHTLPTDVIQTTRIEEFDAMDLKLTPGTTVNVVLESHRPGVDKSYRTVTFYDVADTEELARKLNAYLTKRRLPLDYPIEYVEVI